MLASALIIIVQFFLCYDMILWYNSVFSMPQFKLLLKRSYIMPIFNYLSTKFITLNTIIMFIYMSHLNQY